MNIFEEATRLKLRFDTSKGKIGVEDLWDLPLTSNTGRVNLDDIARGLNAELKSVTAVSFVTEDSPQNTVRQLQFDVVIHVINVKIRERKAAQDAAAIKEKKQKIMSFIEKKQDESLNASTLEDLQAMLASM